MCPEHAILKEDEEYLLSSYRTAKNLVHSSMEVVLSVHVQDGILVQINTLKKDRPIRAVGRKLKD